MKNAESKKSKIPFQPQPSAEDQPPNLHITDGKKDVASQSPLNQKALHCPQCGSQRIYKDGLRYLSSGKSVQRWLCRDCGFRFSEPHVKVDVSAEPLKLLNSGPPAEKVNTLETSP